MKRQVCLLVTAAMLGTSVGTFGGGEASAQDLFQGEGQFSGAGSVGSNEPLFNYDDQEPWKHGYLKTMPYYHGFHSFRPYNYHHVFGQTTTAQGFGMSAVMPYSQQFWHRYEHMADLSQGNHEPVYPGTPPTKENSHYPKPINDAAIPGIPSASMQHSRQVDPVRLSGPYHQRGYVSESYGNGAIGPGVYGQPMMTPTAQAPTVPPQQNFSQIFHYPQQQSIAPVQFQNSEYPAPRPVLQGPSLPAPGFAY